jgi:hypothetical protein
LKNKKAIEEELKKTKEQLMMKDIEINLLLEQLREKEKIIVNLSE